MIKVSSSFALPLPPDRVFAALVDPAVLQRCIPGCEALEEVAPDVYEARLKIGVITSPNTAIAISAETRDAALLIPDAAPANRWSTAFKTAVVNGATLIAIPRPSTTAAGKNVNQ